MRAKVFFIHFITIISATFLICSDCAAMAKIAREAVEHAGVFSKGAKLAEGPKLWTVGREAEGFRAGGVRSMEEALPKSEALADLKFSGHHVPPQNLEAETAGAKKKPGEKFTYKLTPISTNPFLIQRNPKMLVAFPLNRTQYEKVFKRPVSKAAESEMKQLTKLVNNSGKNDVLFFDVTFDFNSQIANIDQGETVVLVGHSKKDGEIIILPNGEEVHYEDIQKASQEHKINIITLTCFSRDLNLQEKILARDAVKTWSLAKNKLTKKSKFKPIVSEKYIAMLRDARYELKVRGNVKITATIGGGISTAYIFSSEQG